MNIFIKLYMLFVFEGGITKNFYLFKILKKLISWKNIKIVEME
jgi:hypothetical protein